MQIYPIVLVPDPVLKTEAAPLSKIDDVAQGQIDRMLATMYDARGIGLAANQVGILNRVLVMDLMGATWVTEDDADGIAHIESTFPEDRAINPVVMINPEIVWRSDRRSLYDEGCLSIPGHWAEIVRPAEVRVSYQDRTGATQELLADGLLSHCVQHEIDHLNGVLFIDYLSKLKRDMIVRKVEKAKKTGDGDL